MARSIPTDNYRSKFEARFAKQLKELGLHAEYETEKIYYVVPETKRVYKPDWRVAKGVFIETKGRFTAADRSKQLQMRECNPETVVYMLFQDSSVRLSKRSGTTYGEWCTKHGIPWSDIKDTEKWRSWFNH